MLWQEPNHIVLTATVYVVSIFVPYNHGMNLTLLGLGLIKINTVSANFNNPRPSLILNN